MNSFPDYGQTSAYHHQLIMEYGSGGMHLAWTSINDKPLANTSDSTLTAVFYRILGAMGSKKCSNLKSCCFWKQYQ
jgi:hypothetical protein